MFVRILAGLMMAGLLGAAAPVLAQGGVSLIPQPTGTVGYDPDTNTLTVECLRRQPGRFGDQSQNIGVTILDNPEEGWTDITIEAFTLDELVNARWTKASIDRYVVKLCGRSNSFSYMVAAGVESLRRAKSFDITGGDGFDYVTINLANNGAGRPMAHAAPVEVDLDLGGLQDQVELRLRPAKDGALDLVGDLGPGNDGFGIVTYAGTITRAYDLSVAGGMGNDWIFVPFTQPQRVHQGGRIRLRLSGDTLPEPGVISPMDNVADHGADVVVGAFDGRVDGTVDIELDGDDGLQRIRDLACLNAVGGFNCAFRGPATRGLDCRGAVRPNPLEPSLGPCDLEDALRNLPGYAYDKVQAHLDLESIGPQGTVRAVVDGGLGTDESVMIVKMEDATRAARLDASLTGGQEYRWQYDLCFVDGTSSQVRDRIVVENCDEFDEDIVLF